MACDLLYRRVYRSTDLIEDHILPYVCYNPENGQLEHLETRSGFSEISQKLSLVPQVQPTRTGDEIDRVASDLTANMDFAIRRLAYLFLQRLNKLLWDHTLYTLEDH